MTRTQYRTTVVRTEQLTPHLVRVVVGGDVVAEFPDNGCTDRYVKLMFPRPGVELPDDGTELWALPMEQRPIMRTYTIRAIDPINHQLTIDFVTHGDDGVAGPWAMRAKPGDELIMSGPGGAYAPLLDADLHLLVGDEAAIPAIASALEAMGSGANVIAIVEVQDASEELALPSPADVDLRWVHRADGAGPEALLDAVRELDLPDGRVQAFVHGELHVTRAIRRHLVDAGVLAELLSASGYWRRGKDEDGFQAEKRELAQADRAAAGA